MSAQNMHDIPIREEIGERTSASGRIIAKGEHDMSGMAWAGRLGIVIAIIIIEKASPALAWFLVAATAVLALCFLLYGGKYRGASDPLGRQDHRQDLSGTQSPGRRP